MRYSQLTLDGVAVEQVLGRFTGTIELEQEEARMAGYDEIHVGVIVFHVGAPDHRSTSKGELNRVNRFEVNELRVLTGELREAVVSQCGLYGPDTAQLSLLENDGYVPAARPRPEGITDDGEYEDPPFTNPSAVDNDDGPRSEPFNPGRIGHVGGTGDELLADFLK
jgi:hypothetical protein